MKKIVFITDRDAEYGFSLAGVQQSIAQTDEAESMIRSIMDDPDYGLVVVDERLMDKDMEERLRERENLWNGVLLVLPSPQKPPPETEDYAARMIRRAIGYHVRLNV